MTETFRALNPDRTRKSKPCDARQISAALNRGQIGEDWVVECVQTGIVVPVSEFVQPTSVMPELPFIIETGKRSSSTPGRSSQRNRWKLSG